jgi:hypothetical protein
LEERALFAGFHEKAERAAIGDSFDADPASEPEGGVGVGAKADGLAILSVDAGLVELADELDGIVTQAKEADVLMGVKEAGVAGAGEAHKGSVGWPSGEARAVEREELRLHLGVDGAAKPVETDAGDQDGEGEKAETGGKEVFIADDPGEPKKGKGEAGNQGQQVSHELPAKGPDLGSFVGGGWFGFRGDRGHGVA